jgi:hypothetical protein
MNEITNRVVACNGSVGNRSEDKAVGSSPTDQRVGASSTVQYVATRISENHVSEAGAADSIYACESIVTDTRDITTYRSM